MRATTEEKRDKLEQTDLDLFQKLNLLGGRVYFKLSRDGNWWLDPASDHATVYDAETQYRWEWAYGRYVRISAPLRLSLADRQWQLSARGKSLRLSIICVGRNEPLESRL